MVVVVVQQDFPRQARVGERAVLRVGGAAGERERLSDAEELARRRSDDRRSGRRVAYINANSVGGGAASTIADRHDRVIRSHLRVAVRRGCTRAGRVVTEVPTEAERVTIRVAAACSIE